MMVVTGASGFIGRNLVAVLAARGQATLAASRRAIAVEPPARARQVADYGQLELAEVDDVLIHLAEPRDIAAVEANAERPDAGVRATLAALLAKAWGHVVYISSAAVYGDRAERACRPEDATNPVN